MTTLAAPDAAQHADRSNAAVRNIGTAPDWQALGILSEFEALGLAAIDVELRALLVEALALPWANESVRERAAAALSRRADLEGTISARCLETISSVILAGGGDTSAIAEAMAYNLAFARKLRAALQGVLVNRRSAAA